MTSQVILGNGHGVAIASDSAVTFGNRRTYDTSEKIYAIKQPHSLAVLHAGNVTFHGMPYSTILDSYFHSLGDVQLMYVNDYVHSFRKFLVEELHTWCDVAQQNLDFLSALNDEFHRIWKRHKADEEELSEESALKIWQSEIARCELFESHGFDSSWVDKWMQSIWTTQANGWDGAEGQIEYWFDDVPRSSEIDSAIKKFVRSSITHFYPMSDENSATLTFVGYGRKSMIPHSVQLEIFGALGDSVMLREEEANISTRQENGFLLVELIGQTDAIHSFLRGYDKDLMAEAESALSQMFTQDDGESHENVALAEGNHVKEGKRYDVNEQALEDALEKAFGGYAEKNKLASFRWTITGMPLASLVSTAKSLIDIQRLSLDIRGRLPTVGGPVKVATITKVGGFQWENRD